MQIDGLSVLLMEHYRYGYGHLAVRQLSTHVSPVHSSADRRSGYLCEEDDLEARGTAVLGLAIVQVVPHRQHKLGRDTAPECHSHIHRISCA